MPGATLPLRIAFLGTSKLYLWATICTLSLSIFMLVQTLFLNLICAVNCVCYESWEACAWLDTVGTGLGLAH